MKKQRHPGMAGRGTERAGVAAPLPGWFGGIVLRWPESRVAISWAAAQATGLHPCDRQSVGGPQLGWLGSFVASEPPDNTVSAYCDGPSSLPAAPSANLPHNTANYPPSSPPASPVNCARLAYLHTLYESTDGWPLGGAVSTKVSWQKACFFETLFLTRVGAVRPSSACNSLQHHPSAVVVLISPVSHSRQFYPRRNNHTSKDTNTDTTDNSHATASMQVDAVAPL